MTTSILLVFLAAFYFVGSVSGNATAFVYDDDGNISDYSVLLDEHPHLLMPIWAYRITAGYLFTVSVVGFILNVIVVVVLLNDPKKMTPLNWMLFNLACSDALIAGFRAPISAAAAIYSGWPFSKEFCVAYAMITSTAEMGSIATLSALAICRCKLVVQKHVHPPNRISAFTNHSVRLGCRQAILLLSVIWGYALAVTCPPLFGWGHYDREAAHISCSVDLAWKVGNSRSYIFYVFSMGLFVPSVAIVVSYCNILRVVRKVKREIAQRNILMQNNLQKTRRKDAAEKRSTVMVAVMIGAFTITWLPYSILALMEFFGTFTDGTIAPVWATVPCLLAKISAVLNPIIYGFLNTQFRSTWENFSVRFLGRRHYNNSQGAVVTTSSNEQHPQTKQLNADMSVTALPLTKMSTQTTSSSSKIRRISSSPPNFFEGDKIFVIDDHQPPRPSSQMTTGCCWNEGDEQKENQPLSLEIVRYVPSGDIQRSFILNPLLVDSN